MVVLFEIVYLPILTLPIELFGIPILLLFATDELPFDDASLKCEVF